MIAHLADVFQVDARVKPEPKASDYHLILPRDVLAFIDQERASHGVSRLCRLFGVTRAAYYP